jgi:transposase
MNGTKIIINLHAAKSAAVSMSARHSSMPPSTVAAKLVHWTNTPEGRAAIVGIYRDHGADRIVVEASGGYEIEIVAAMRNACLNVVVLQPAQVPAYAKS